LQIDTQGDNQQGVGEMAIANNDHKSNTAHHLERLRQATEYLRMADPREFTPEEYAEFEEAILKVWVWVNLRREFQDYLFDITNDVRGCMSDVIDTCRDTKRHVGRTRYRNAGPGARGVACGRYFTQFCDENT
jgi:hypothetical protein